MSDTPSALVAVQRLPWWKARSSVGADKKEEAFYRAGQWTLVWWKFRRHKLAQFGMVVLGVFYLFAIFAEFASPHQPLHRFKTAVSHPPMRMHLFDHEGRWQGPFIYGEVMERDPVTFRPKYKEDLERIYPIRLFVPGDEYKFWSLWPANRHLIGTGEADAPLLVLGTDDIGRDVLSRVIHGGRISLTIGLVGVALSFVIGLALGGLAGYFGGIADEVIMRIVDVLVSLPAIPLWMSLAAALPANWPTQKTYFFVTIILSVLGWTSLARTVRGKMLSLREEDYVMAAGLDGESRWQTITRYMLPGFTSYIIVQVTLAIPNMILGETALSFLGIGLQPPAVSWGVMLNEAQELQVLVQTPWLLLPVAFVVLAVLMFNFLGDGLRDAADPYVI